MCRGAEATGAEGAAAPVSQTVRGQQVAPFDSTCTNEYIKRACEMCGQF